MKKCLLLGVLLTLCLSTLAFAAPRIKASLDVEISQDKKYLNAIYTIENLTDKMIAPSQSDTYHYAIRNVDTGKEVAKGELDDAFVTSVSQYASPYAHAVFAVKNIPITNEMKNNPGFYLMFLCVSGDNVLGEETVFYIPENL